MNILKGLGGLSQSRKAWFCGIILSIATAALFTKFLTGAEWSGVIGTLAVIYNASHAYQESNQTTPPPASQKRESSLEPKGQI